ncbi:acyltransferase [Ideonella sp. DXS29W]|uniref:Acyltransferase n=1 Tax=Ideonella lacteola TaxID=2984193 RepID=A0ABU9BUY6_9BURK
MNAASTSSPSVPDASAGAGLPPRQPGLDLLRALAIGLVFLYHYQVFVSKAPTFGWLGNIGWTGVDLFFVLSGYLIGHQVFAGVARGQTLSVPAFYARRLLRTMPAFWVVLALYFLFPAVMGGKTPPPLWRFLSFTQNWNLQPGTAFSHAWSLCIEEQFYLVLPLLVWLGLRAAAAWHLRVSTLWGVLAALTLMAMAWRASLWDQFGREVEAGGVGTQGYYPAVYYATLSRIDEFIPGIAVALWRHAHPARWATAMARGRIWFAGACAVVALVWYGVAQHYYIDGYGYGRFMTVAGYSLIAWGYAALVVAALCSDSPLRQWRVPGAGALAAWSYSIYLTHKAVAVNVAQSLASWSLPQPVVIVLVSLACVFAGWVLYRVVEKPVMRWRDRQVPTLFPPTGGTQGDAGGSSAALR